ncbi:MAG TPA: hypothetical protein VFL57_00545, partial [Bryobacteraceae bacterium]|nr:hypothetical protein [Bryobacteraceae bacterium]
MYAQFRVGGRNVQVHGFVSQGFAWSDNNNYLTMNTSKGDFVFTDGGANVSTQLTDQFRVGAQVYVRHIGELGEFRPMLDWAMADYNTLTTKSETGLEYVQVRSKQCSVCSTMFRIWSSCIPGPFFRSQSIR